MAVSVSAWTDAREASFCWIIISSSQARESMGLHKADTEKRVCGNGLKGINHVYKHMQVVHPWGARGV
jgi:hypothetical protein